VAEASPPLIDMHVHLWGTGDGGSGIRVHPRYRWSPTFLGAGLALGMHWRRAESYDAYYLKLLLEALDASPLEFAVVQGMEGVYDADGRLDGRRTAIYIPNDYVYRVCREHDCLLPAAAVSPARADWQAELDRAAEQGALYVKLNPCAGRTPVGAERWRAFYRRLRRLGLALVCHTGPERSLWSGPRRLGDPAGLELPLSEGLVVVAAHAATGTLLEGGRPFENMVRLMERFGNLYADTSAVAQWFRWRWLGRLAGHELVRSRLLHGSDYPVPITLLPWGVLSPASWRRVRRLRSRLARDLAVKEEAGFGLASARRAARVLGVGS